METNSTPPPHILSDEERRKRILDSIPRLSDIDSCKENIQPFRKGRSTTSVLSTLLTNSAAKDEILQAGHAQYQEQLKNIDEQDDPLETYINYIDWTIQMYPEGPKGGSNLLWLLQDATDHFVNDPRYKSDARYLKLWLEYVRHSSNQKNVYLYLIEHDIGQTLALFYEEYASYYERLNKTDEATEVYLLGISKDAIPIKRLKHNYDLFKARVHERQQKGLLRKQQMEAKKQMDTLKATGLRTMLGQKFDSQSRVSVPANIHAGLEARFGGSTGLASSSSSSHSRSFGNSGTPSSTANNNLRSQTTSESFSVFVESTPSSPSRSSILPSRSSFATSTSTSTSTSLYLNTVSSSSHRENQRPVEKFAGATLQQAPGSVPQAVADKFQVYQDPEESVQSPSHTATLERAYSTSSMLSVSTSEGGESTNSKQRRFPVMDPTQKKKRRKDREAHEVPEFLKTRFMQRRHLYFQSTDTKGELEFIPILHNHEHNVSFEELRANFYMKNEQPSTKKGKERADVQEEQDSQQEADGLSRYYKKQLKEKRPAQEYTTETLAAMESIGNLFNPEAHYTKEEEDLTWENPYQRFDPVYRPPVNENE